MIGHGRPYALGTEVLDPDWQHTVGGATDPWGQAIGSGLGYRGEFAVDGLVWLRARAYDPGTRAFLAPDPLPAVPGTAYAANPYHYAGNDPVNNVDPLGLRPVTDAELAGEQDSGGGLLSTIGHGILDVAGLVPVVGEAADLANAAWYTAEGDYTMAALSAATAIPFAGWAATGAKGAIKGVRAADAAGGTTSLFRAVSTAEADDIAQYGFRQAPNGQSYEGKLFATSAEDAARYGRINYGLDQQPFHIVEASVPNSFADRLYTGTADRMTFRSADPDQLPELNAVGSVHRWDHVPLVEKP